jgi:hypothetical protein
LPTVDIDQEGPAIQTGACCRWASFSRDESQVLFVKRLWLVSSRSDSGWLVLNRCSSWSPKERLDLRARCEGAERGLSVALKSFECYTSLLMNGVLLFQSHNEFLRAVSDA